MELKSTLTGSAQTVGGGMTMANHQAVSLEGHVWWLILCQFDWAMGVFVQTLFWVYL